MDTSEDLRLNYTTHTWRIEESMVWKNYKKKSAQKQYTHYSVHNGQFAENQRQHIIVTHW